MIHNGNSSSNNSVTTCVLCIYDATKGSLRRCDTNSHIRTHSILTITHTWIWHTAGIYWLLAGLLFHVETFLSPKTKFNSMFPYFNWRRAVTVWVGSAYLTVSNSNYLHVVYACSANKINNFRRAFNFSLSSLSSAVDWSSWNRFILRLSKSKCWTKSAHTTNDYRISIERIERATRIDNRRHTQAKTTIEYWNAKTTENFQLKIQIIHFTFVCTERAALVLILSSQIQSKKRHSVVSESVYEWEVIARNWTKEKKRKIEYGVSVRCAEWNFAGNCCIANLPEMFAVAVREYYRSVGAGRTSQFSCLWRLGM